MVPRISETIPVAAHIGWEQRANGQVIVGQRPIDLLQTEIFATGDVTTPCCVMVSFQRIDEPGVFSLRPPPERCILDHHDPVQKRLVAHLLSNPELAKKIGNQGEAVLLVSLLGDTTTFQQFVSSVDRIFNDLRGVMPAVVVTTLKKNPTPDGVAQALAFLERAHDGKPASTKARLLQLVDRAVHTLPAHVKTVWFERDSGNYQQPQRIWPPQPVPGGAPQTPRTLGIQAAIRYG